MEAWEPAFNVSSSKPSFALIVGRKEQCGLTRNVVFDIAMNLVEEVPKKADNLGIKRAFPRTPCGNLKPAPAPFFEKPVTRIGAEQDVEERVAIFALFDNTHVRIEAVSLVRVNHFANP